MGSQSGAAQNDPANAGSKKLTVALSTPHIRRYSGIADFRAHVSELAQAAVAAGAQVLLLPELLCVGLLWSSARAGKTNVPDVQSLYEDVLTPLLPDYKRALSDIARDNGLTLVGASFWHKEGNRSLNSGFVFRPDGRVLRQDKLHPTRPERAIGTSGGDSLALFEIEGVTCASIICYDVQFPEVSRLLADQGLEVLFVPSLTDERGVNRVAYCAHARAIENQAFVCVSPLVGDLGIPNDRPIHGEGEAFVASPIDNNFKDPSGVYSQEQNRSGELIVAELDIGLLRRTRVKSEIRQLNDRRKDFYATVKPELAGP